MKAQFWTPKTVQGKNENEGKSAPPNHIIYNEEQWEHASKSLSLNRVIESLFQ